MMDTYMLEGDNFLVPSKVTSHRWVYVSSPSHRLSCSSDVIEDDAPSTIGKWLLFNSTEAAIGQSLTPHDRAWQSIVRLVSDVSNTDIISAKCSTSSQESLAAGSFSEAVICCYTADYQDKLTVKAAADEIRKVYLFPRDMFYKTDEATYAGEYRSRGSKAISMYKHSLNGQFYERDSNSKWILVDFEMCHNQ